MSFVGERLKSLRKSESLTQKEFSKRLLISQSYLSGLENDNEAPTSKLLKLICLEFGVNEEWLVNGIGEMYDEVYENDKAALVEVSNSSLLRILTLLATKSNVEYGLYAYTIDAFISILNDGKYFDEDSKMKFLEIVQMFTMDFERLLYVTLTSASGADLGKHKAEIYKDMEQIFVLLDAMNNIQPK